MTPKFVAVVGPTASGKTALSVALAERLRGEVVSCDSMQIYRGMQIGTAAPTEVEMRGIPHHMIGVVDPMEPFSCADYTAAAEASICRIHDKGKIPILCGGTGLYLDSLLRVDSFTAPEGDAAIRAGLTAFAQEHGEEALHARLAAVDPEAAAAIHPRNVRRVIRAVEIFEQTGMTKTEWDRRSLAQKPKYDAFIIVLDFRDRERLYERINRRVDIMLADGLEEEVRALYNKGFFTSSSSAAQAIGYKEFLPYFSGEATLADAAEQIRLASRRYAKRQLTWFRRYTDALWLYPDDDGAVLRDVSDLAERAECAMRESGWLAGAAHDENGSFAENT